jgi:hypothetical protein
LAAVLLIALFRALLTWGCWLNSTIVNKIIVEARFDEDAGVWYVEESNLAGLRAEAESAEALLAKLPSIVEDLIELNHVDLHGSVPIELIAHAQVFAHA